jgi:formylglycine-generating enzyme required for sulfatase activity/DNA-directed RNA polymerase subunit RPC12/RpoP
MKTCPICQQAYSDDVEFCAREGARLSGEVREERECPYCAERILKKARVCKHCGRDVEPLVAAETAAPAPSPCPPEKTVETPAAPPPEKKPLWITKGSPNPAKPPQFEIISDKPTNMKYVVMGGVALVLFILGVWFLFQHGAKKGEVRDNPSDGLKYVWIPSGSFTMGCSPGDNECYDFEKPSHQVSIAKGFWLTQTEVTVGAYKRFAQAVGRQMPPEPDMGGRALNPGWGNESMPVVEVSWGDAQAYCRWAGGRLPTEAEWEYAARAENPAARYDKLDDIAWYAENSGGQRLDTESIWKKVDQAGFVKILNENGNAMHEVGQKRPNALGLSDMLGNVWEWVNDWWDPGYYKNSPSQDPMGPSGGTERVMRGGSWVGRPRDVRVSLRNRRIPGDRDFDLGFRCGGDMDIP